SIVLYILCVFSWWLFSFIRFVNSEYELEKENLALTVQIIRDNITQKIENGYLIENNSPHQYFIANEDKIRKIHLELNNLYNIKTNISVVDTFARVSELISIKLAESESLKIKE